MTSIAYSPVSIQTSEHSAPLPAPWFGEVVLLVAHLRKQGVLAAISEQVGFARRRFGRGSRDRLCGGALRLPSAVNARWKASTSACVPSPPPSWRGSRGSGGPRVRRSRADLAALTPPPVETLRTLFLADRLARPLGNEQEGQSAGLWDRQGSRWLVFDIDGTKLRRPA